MDQRCDACKYWKYNGNEYNMGECSKIQEKIEIELELGWDGGCVDYIETEADFGCNLFEEIN
ncbi:MAG: hypothetical protein WBF39_04100 [Planococcus donghaensis]